MLSVADTFLTRHMRRVLKKDKKTSLEELADLGIARKDVESLLEWRENIKGFPTGDDLLATDGGFYNDAAALWSQAVARMVEQVIQNPRRYTRPAAALDPRWRMIYGIMGFSYAFHSNLLVPIFKRGVDAKKSDESAVAYRARQALQVGDNIARKALPGMAVLFMAQALNTILREMLFNPDRWDEMDWDDEEKVRKFALNALSRSALLGAWDRPFNMVSGIKYQTDLASVMAGPHVGWQFSNIEDMAMVLTDRNSPNTNTAERRAAETAMDLFFETGLTLAISAVPGSPISDAAGAATIWGIRASGPGELLAEELFPSD